MSRYVAVILILMVFHCVTAPPPMRVTIDCPTDNRDSASVRYSSGQKSLKGNNGHFDADSFCSLINSAIPKAVEDGRFILLEEREDQEEFGNTLIPISKPPPNGFIPNFIKMRAPRLRIPKIKVPSLSFPDRPRLRPPKVGSPMFFSRAPEADTSAERMEQFKKGVQKMLHVVKVLGQVDQYLSERTRIIIDKLSKTFAD